MRDGLDRAPRPALAALAVAAALAASGGAPAMPISDTPFIKDTTPPVLTLPEKVTARAVSPAGAVVAFDVSVTDDLDLEPLVTCTPAAGTTFPIGTTVVTCEAIDWFGNSATGSFNVVVLGADEQIGGVARSLEDKIGANPNTPLGDKAADAVAKAQTALAEIAKSDRQAAAGAIEGAVGDLEAAVKDGLLSPAYGGSLMDELVGASRLLAVTALGEAAGRGGKADAVAEAQQLLTRGDDLRGSGRFKDAAASYKDAIAKAESA